MRAGGNGAARASRPRRALLAVNGKSRGGRRGIGAAIDLLRGRGLELIDANCASGGDLAACIAAQRTAVDCVIVAGGDGSVNAAGQALVETGLPLGVLPLGTANDFARSIGIPLELEAAARVIAEGFLHRIDVGEVNGRVFFNVASVGIAADLARSLTTERKRRFGRFSYALTAGRLLLEAKPFHATLLRREGASERGQIEGGQIDAGQLDFDQVASGEVAPGEVAPGQVEGSRSEAGKVMVRTLQITVGNGRYYGGGNVVASDARIDDGRLHLYSLEFPQIWRMALMVPAFPRGEHGSMREVRTATGHAFEIITRKPRPVNADGELVTQTPALFTQTTRALGVYVPESCPLLLSPPPA